MARVVDLFRGAGAFMPEPTIGLSTVMPQGRFCAKGGAAVLEPEFPFEFVVSGTPMSLGSSADSRESWRREVQQASKAVLPEGHWLTDARIAVTLYYFPAEPMEGTSTTSSSRSWTP
jgi:hypothetical protein